jgi:hypothetical protein
LTEPQTLFSGLIIAGSSLEQAAEATMMAAKPVITNIVFFLIFQVDDTQIILGHKILPWPYFQLTDLVNRFMLLGNIPKFQLVKLPGISLAF